MSIYIAKNANFKRIVSSLKFQKSISCYYQFEGLNSIIDWDIQLHLGYKDLEWVNTIHGKPWLSRITDFYIGNYDKGSHARIYPPFSAVSKVYNCSKEFEKDMDEIFSEK